MEVSGVVSRPLHGGDATHVRHSSSSFPSSDKIHLRFLSLKPLPNRRPSVSSNLSLVSANASSGFRDNGHVEYYDGPTTATCCVGMKKEKEKEKGKEISSKKKTMKKKLKLLKGLSKNLSSFSDMGFGLDPDNGLADQVKGKMISEAADLLLVQLQQLRADEMELKRQNKEEKAKLKNMRMQKRMGCEDTSSSSSSESSDSECGEVVDMNHLKTGTLASNALQPPETVDQKAPKFVLPSTTVEVIAPPSMDSIQARLPAVAPSSSEISNENCCSSGSITRFKSNVCSNDRNGLVVEASAKKIEVCMGGKCKKSGAGLLLDEFQKAVGGEGAVVGCKCMGKCRDGPNVRVKYPETETSNPLCIGVGLEDVSLIVSKFFGGNQHSELGLAQPAAS